jgi:hypothetical protein
VRSETKRANISHAELLRNAAPVEKKTAGIAANPAPNAKTYKGKAAYGCADYKQVAFYCPYFAEKNI